MRNKTAIMIDSSVKGTYHLFSMLSVKYVLLYPTFIFSRTAFKKNSVKDTLSSYRKKPFNLSNMPAHVNH